MITKYVRKRPVRRNERHFPKRGAIYLPGYLVGIRVKIVNIKIFSILMNRLKSAETKLRKINKISK